MRKIVKRAMDITGAAAALTLLSPVMITTSAAVAIKLGRPVIFSQVRPGLHGEPFTIMKFRTMTDERGPDGELLPDAQRLTSFGKFLRKTSLDELPELINVLRGDMSLVGPRPLRMSYLEYYTAEQARRHDMRPGITGWAQVNGRNSLTWEEKFAHDVWYVDNWSPLLDLKILIKTVQQVFTQEGISHDGFATMPKFRGTSSQDGGKPQAA